MSPEDRDKALVLFHEIADMSVRPSDRGPRQRRQARRKGTGPLQGIGPAQSPTAVRRWPSTMAGSLDDLRLLDPGHGHRNPAWAYKQSRYLLSYSCATPPRGTCTLPHNQQ
jgi:hypothetical protein